MTDEAIVESALRILTRQLCIGTVFDSPNKVKDFLCLKIGSLEHEVFAVMFLNGQHQLITFEEMFRGTLTQTSVYPREIVKTVLYHNASAVIFAHNHPSGVCEPSRADEFLTSTLKTALAIIDVRVLDHIVCGGSNTVSMAERGLI